jgi:hypothetical protein
MGRRQVEAIASPVDAETGCFGWKTKRRSVIVLMIDSWRTLFPLLLGWAAVMYPPGMGQWLEGHVLAH